MAWLAEHEVEHDYRNILKEPLAEEELAHLARLGKTTVVGLLNPKSTGLKALEVDLNTISDSEAAKIIFNNPKTMYRPLLTDGKNLVIGFKPDQFADMVR